MSILAERCLSLRSSSTHSTYAKELELALDQYAPFRRTISVDRLHLEQYIDEPWPS